MLFSFWLLTVLLCVMAALFIVVPFIKSKKFADLDQTKINLALYQQRLQELQEEFKAGLFTQEQLQLAQVELQQNLLQDTSADSNSRHSRASGNLHNMASRLKDSRLRGNDVIKKWFLPIFLLIALTLLAYTLYWHLGAYQQVKALVMAKQNAQAAQALRQELGTPDHVIAMLQQYLAQDPNSARGWFLLGRLYASQQKFDLATQAFAKANQLQPNDPDTLFQYAQALYLTQHSLQGKPTQLLQQLLKLQPQNDLAKNLIAVAAFERGDYATAIQIWETLLTRYPTGSSEQQALLNAIAKAQLLAGNKQTKVTANIVLHVKVTLAPALSNKISADDLLFIYAKAVDGPPMPLAIVRKQVKDLPVTVTLDDTKAMMPSLALSHFSKVIVIARISKSGQADPQPGDLQGSTSVIDLMKASAKQLITVDINKVL